MAFDPRLSDESDAALLMRSADGDAGAAAELYVIPAPPLPQEQVERAHALRRLHAAIRALPPHYRDVLILVELQEMSYADTAAITRIELGTVRSRLARARARLAELLSASTAMKDGPTK